MGELYFKTKARMSRTCQYQCLPFMSFALRQEGKGARRGMRLDVIR